MSLSVPQNSMAEIMSPGERVSSVYTSEENCDVFKDKVNFNNRFVYQLNNQQLNAQQVQVNIPNDGLFNYLFLSLGIAGAGDSITNVMGLVPVPAYTIIQQIQYQLFGSTIYQIDGIQNMESVFSDCQTQEQLNELILLAGGPGIPSGGYTAAVQKNMYAALAIPWNRIYNNLKKKGLIDMTMSQQPMTIRISFRGANSIYYAVAGTPSFPTSFTNSYIQTRVGNFYDRNDALKLKEQVVEDGKVIEKTNVYSIPIRYEYSTITQVFPGSQVPSPPTTAILTGFMSGNLSVIRLGLYNIGSHTTIQVPATSSTNYIAAETPLNLHLQFNGLDVFRSDNDAFKMDSLFNFTVPRKASVDGTNFFYWVEIPISRFLAEEIGDCFNYGVNLSSQTLNLYLNTAQTDNYQFYVTYVYSSSMGMDGNTATYFF